MEIHLRGRPGNEVVIVTEDASGDIRHTYVTECRAAAIVIVDGTATVTHNVVEGHD